MDKQALKEEELVKVAGGIGEAEIIIGNSKFSGFVNMYELVSGEKYYFLVDRPFFYPEPMDFRSTRRFEQNNWLYGTLTSAREENSGFQTKRVFYFDCATMNGIAHSESLRFYADYISVFTTRTEIK